MCDDQVNPYQPVEVPREPLGDSATEVNFRLTKSLLRHGEDHYLLHCYPRRLLFSSLAMIFASVAAILWASRLGTIVFGITMGCTLTLSTLIYLALVHHAKIKIRTQLRERGLVRDTTCSVSTREEQFVLASSRGEHRWPNDKLKVYRTPMGTLICPEPMFFVYVPRRNNSPREAYKALRAKLTADREAKQA